MNTNMRALLVEVNYRTGRRAGGVDPRDENLQCYGWQSLPEQVGPDVELRLVEDDRSLAQYRDAAGVRVLEGQGEIKAAIERFVPERPDDLPGERKSLEEIVSSEDWGRELGEGNGLPSENEVGK